MHKFFGCFLLAIFFVAETKAQSDSVKVCESSCCCNNEVALPAGVMLGHVHAKGEWMLSYRYMNMGMEGVQQNGTVLHDNMPVFNDYVMAPSHMYMNMHMLMAMYGINNRLTLMAMLHLNHNMMEMEMLGAGGNHVHSGSVSHGHEMSSIGLGDTKLYAMYALKNSLHHKWIVNAGVSFPTGSIEETDNDGDRLAYNMQLGSGTVDVLPGLTYLYHNVKYTVGAQLNGVVRFGYNKLGYSKGNEASFNIWYAYRWLRFLSSSLRLEAQAMDRIYGNDNTLYYFTEPANNPINYGGTLLAAHVGTSWQPASSFFKNQKLSAEFGLPFYQNWRGYQMPLKYSINAYWTLTF